ncbi:hypothetical protein ECPA32_1276, partial [Escherichia coli PA32]
MPCWLT